MQCQVLWAYRAPTAPYELIKTRTATCIMYMLVQQLVINGINTRHQVSYIFATSTCTLIHYIITQVTQQFSILQGVVVQGNYSMT